MGEELFDQAREVNFSYRAAVADVQMQILDGEWALEGYGEDADQCERNRYMFRLGRATPEGWRIEGSPAEAAARVAAWLDDNGWSDIKTRTYSEGIADVLVEAKKPESYVGLLTVEFNPGQLFDSAIVNADSTCEPGDANEIAELQRPGLFAGTAAEIRDDRTTEHPEDPVSFGYSAEGLPRFWGDKTEESR